MKLEKGRKDRRPTLAEKTHTRLKLCACFALSEQRGEDQYFNIRVVLVDIGEVPY